MNVPFIVVLMVTVLRVDVFVYMDLMVMVANARKEKFKKMELAKNVETIAKLVTSAILLFVLNALKDILNQEILV